MKRKLNPLERQFVKSLDDSSRLDWLDNHRVVGYLLFTHRTRSNKPSRFSNPGTLREAIDEAMKEEP